LYIFSNYTNFSNFFNQSLLLAAIMRFNQAIILGLPAFAAAYPGMGSRSEMEAQFRAEMEREAAEKREAEPQLLNPVGNLLGALGDTVSGLLNSVGQAIVVQDNKRPEPGFDF
jgi:hypothetical protein